MKYFLFTLFLFAASCIFLKANSQKIIRNSLYHTPFICQENVVITEGAGATATIDNAVLNTTKSLTFTNNTVVLSNATIECDELIFQSGVAGLQISGNVIIKCKSLTMPAAASLLVSNSGIADLKLICIKGLPTTRDFLITGNSNFTVTIVKK